MEYLGLIVVVVLAILVVPFFVRFLLALKDRPPREIPEGLGATQYYDLGVKYKEYGSINQAQKALQLAIKLDGEGEIGKKATRYLQCYLPLQPVSIEVESRTLRGVGLMIVNKDGAEKAFQSLIEEYPNFEWPYCNLALMYLKRNNREEAKQLLLKVVTINPLYVRARLHLAQAHLDDANTDAASQACRQALDLDPDCDSARFLSHHPKVKSMLKQLKKV